MDFRQLIQKCLIDKDAIETRPWAQDEYKEFVVMRHQSNNKWFGLIFEMNGELCINLKCPPDLIPVLKDQYKAVKPAWHMNKKHWVTVEVNNLPKEVLDEIIRISFEVTASKRKNR